ncbi:MAG TPA: GNAT family N-acetyltransferase [Burkholderiaceae bacterium]|jgi:GNAT superfamily N-acetyltransferase|nr:GNAT family N-acetyltransferase [Burkholderiaceae bacterium]
MEADLVSLRLLQGEPSEMAELQRVLEAAPRYAELVTGVPPGRADAQSTYSILPEGKTYDDKFVFGIYLGGSMVGCADVIRGYPDAATATLGLLLIAEPFQRRGIGDAAYREIEARVLAWEPCDRIRIAVVGTNASVIPFWQRLGFVPTGQTRPYRYGSVVSEAIYLEKPLRSGSPS